MIAMNQELFNKYAVEGSQPVLVEFWAPWCVYCRRIAPALSKVAKQYEGSLAIGQINIDDEPQLAATEQIEVIPTLVLYKDGKALGSVVAPQSKTAIDEFIKNTLSM